MSKRKIIVDGEVKLVSFEEWQKHSDKDTKPKKSKAKLSIKDVQVDSDPINIEPKEQDQNNSEE
jgi:hypothetical protein